MLGKIEREGSVWKLGPLLGLYDGDRDIDGTIVGLEDGVDEGSLLGDMDADSVALGTELGASE